VDREGNTNAPAHCVAESARIICRGGVQPRPRIDYNQPMPLDRLQRARDDDKADTVRYTADVPIGPHDEVASGAAPRFSPGCRPSPSSRSDAGRARSSMRSFTRTTDDRGARRQTLATRHRHLSRRRNVGWFRNYYTCDRCHFEWSDEWSCMCDDKCPACGARDMAPVESDDLTKIIEWRAHTFVVLRSPCSAEHSPDYDEIAVFSSNEQANMYLNGKTQ
jgi:hypothetical protein